MKIEFKNLILGSFILFCGCAVTPQTVTNNSVDKNSTKKVMESGDFNVEITSKTTYKDTISSDDLNKLAELISTSIEIPISKTEPIDKNIAITHTNSYIKISIKAESLFANKENQLSKEAKTVLSKISKNISPDLTLQVIGHTDSKGSYGSNLRVSEERATNVVNYLKSLKLQNKIFTLGCSYKKLLYKGDEKKLSALNKRVEIYIYKNRNDAEDICK